MPSPSRRGRRVNDPASGKIAADAARALRLWRRRLEGALGFLEELTAGDTKLNAAWRQKMKDHYTRVITADLEAIPLGGDRSAKLFRDRLRLLSADGPK